MKTVEVVMVRIYLTESETVSKTIIHYLRDEANIRGITVFRAIHGYGETGEHTSAWIDLALDLPITIEFFDYPEKINKALEHVSQLVKPDHIVFWNALANENDE